MPYQLLYLHGDPESTQIHYQLDKKILLNGILNPREFEAREIAVGYAFCLYDHPEIFINPVKEKGGVKGPGYFGLLDVAKNKIVGLILENK